MAEIGGNMKRLLCIVSSMNTGGAETFLMKIYRNLDKTKYQMDFLVSEKEEGFYDSEIKTLGGNVFYVPPKSESFFKSFWGIKNLVKKEQYEYVLRTNENSLSTLDLLAAKLGGAKVLIQRSSNAGTAGGRVHKILHKLFKFLPKIIPNVKLAPSSEAAIYTFGKKQYKNGKVKILKNSIPFDKFEFKDSIRNNTRKDLGIETNFVVGHIGRFNEQKNHKFLIEIFSEIKKTKENAVLLLIGQGELEDKIKEQIKQMKLENSVKFLGIRTDIPDLLMSMDVFVFPSLYEGMPNTVIEAQATGLPCVISDKITKESNITGLVNFISLDENTEYWAEEILKRQLDRNTKVKNAFIDSGYRIEDSVRKFEKLVFGKVVDETEYM